MDLIIFDKYLYFHICLVNGIPGPHVSVVPLKELSEFLDEKTIFWKGMAI